MINLRDRVQEPHTAHGYVLCRKRDGQWVPVITHDGIFMRRLDIAEYHMEWHVENVPDDEWRILEATRTSQITLGEIFENETNN